MALTFDKNYGKLSSVDALWAGVPVIRATSPAQVETATTPAMTPIVQSEPISDWYRQMSYADTPAAQREKALYDVIQPMQPAMTPIGPVAQMTAEQTVGLTPTDDSIALANAINTNTKAIKEIETAKLERASKLNTISAVAQIGSTIAGGLAMNDYADEVAATKQQYEARKQIIDTNIANSETLIMEKYRESMADLDAIAASKNVDPTSSAIQGIKEQGAIDMGKDFAIRRTNAELQKLALDLDYARSERQARQQQKNYWQQAAVNIGTTALMFL